MTSPAGEPWNGKARVSQLGKPLWDCLHDHTSLSVLEYLIQFLTAKDALPLLQFWFSVASFKNALPSSVLPPNNSETVTESGTLSLVQSGFEVNDTRTLKPQQATTSAIITGADTISVVPTALPNSVIQSRSPTTFSASCDSSNGAGQSAPMTTELVEVNQFSGCSQEDIKSFSTSVNGVRGRGGMEGAVSKKRPNSEVQRTPPDITRQTSLNVVTDAMGIYSTYVALNALTPVHLPDDIRQRVEVNICPEDGTVDRACFNEAQQFVYDLLEKRYYPDFLRSSFMCKFQLELVSSGGLSLLDFLLGGDPLVYFMEFMEQENAMPLLQFWLTAENFHTHVASLGTKCNVEATVQDAIAIYDRYFSLQATEPLGMGDKVRVEIELGICDERGPRPDSFVAAQEIAYHRMIEHYYPSFLESGIYLKFLDDLLRMVKSNPDQDKVVAENSSVNITSDGASHTETEPVHCFTYNVDDPDSLWRQTPLLMRLGYVDTMGQYCSEINPFPTKTMKSREKPKQFRRFRNRQEEEEWELAMKISRTIVAKVLKRTSKK